MRKSPIFLLATILVLTSCNVKSPKTDDKKVKTKGKKVEISKILSGQGSAASKADELVAAAEDLYTPLSFMHAYTVLDVAVKVDPKHLKARLMKASLEPLMNGRNAFNRLSKIIDNAGPRVKSEVKKYREELENKIPESATHLRSFLFGTDVKPFENETELQTHLKTVSQNIEKFRSVLNEAKNARLTFNVGETMRVTEQFVKGNEEICEYVETEFYDYDGTPYYDYEEECYLRKDVKPPLSGSQIVELASPDAEVLIQAAAGQQLGLIPGLSYSLVGLADVIKNATLEENSTDKEISSAIEEGNAKLGTLENKSYFQLVRKLGPDAVEAVKWFRKDQESLCKAGTQVDRQREGYVFGNGICTENINIKGTSRDQLIVNVANSLRGGLVLAFANGISGYSTSIKPIAPIDNPVNDLKSQLPVSFNECGSATELADKTLAGIFPSGDAKKFMTESGTLDRDCYQDEDYED
ncbi:MAG: hypothetical protein KDD25_01200 [Bdellovibrionales bacterium]|nr:hypothetical protein [Bdellovibrionales bacterium]